MSWKTWVQFLAFIYAIIALVYSLVAYTDPNIYDASAVMGFGVISAVILLLTALYYLFGFNEPVTQASH